MKMGGTEITALYHERHERPNHTTANVGGLISGDGRIISRIKYGVTLL
mgnify:CR=1 FL=1